MNVPPHISLGLERHLELDFTPDLDLKRTLAECSGKLDEVLSETCKNALLERF